MVLNNPSGGPLKLAYLCSRNLFVVGIMVIILGGGVLINYGGCGLCVPGATCMYH